MKDSWILLIILMAIVLILDKVMEKLQDKLISTQEEEIKKQADLIKAQMELIEALKIELPTWIPCSERLPTKAGHYLCSFNKPNRIDNIYVDLAYWTGGRWYGYLANEINAWMPLPEPYKEIDDE